MTPRYEVPLSSHFFSVNIHVQYMVLEWNTSPSVPAAHGEIDAPFGPGLLGPLLQALPVEHRLVEQRRGVRRLTRLLVSYLLSHCCGELQSITSCR